MFQNRLVSLLKFFEICKEGETSFEKAIRELFLKSLELKWDEKFFKTCHFKAVLLHPTKYKCADRMCEDNEVFRALRDKAIVEIQESLQDDNGIAEKRRSSLDGLADAMKQEAPENRQISARAMRKKKRKSEKLERKKKRLRVSNNDDDIDIWETFKAIRNSDRWSAEMRESFDADPMNFWKLQQVSKIQKLFRIAKTIYCIPASSTSSERVTYFFSLRRGYDMRYFLFPNEISLAGEAIKNTQIMKLKL